MQNEKILRSGKVDFQILNKFLSSLPQDKSVKIGPGIGIDAAVIKINEEYVAVKTDPITFTSASLGWYVVNINANDIVCVGAKPCWFLVNLLLPPGEKRNFLENFFKQLLNACQELQISLVGGHTEVTSAVNRPIVVGQMIGKIQKDKVICNTDAQVGDVILLTKGLAIEGTHVIYQEKQKELESKISSEFLKRMENFLKNPGISVVKEAIIATNNANIHCMHDPTEGGLIAGLWEIAVASGVEISVDWKSIPIFEETKILCQIYNFDPLRLLASGALILVVPSSEVDKLMYLYKKAGISCAKIGEIISNNNVGVKIIKEGKTFFVEHSSRDELTKLF